MAKNTVVIGASPNADRYSNRATLMLKRYGHPVHPVGMRKGSIDGLKIFTDFPAIEDVDTVTLYVGPTNQPYWYNYILSLKPRRIIFNPGTENPELVSRAERQGVECIQACTLVMLSTGQY
jgi:uncharacterized protein